MPLPTWMPDLPTLDLFLSVAELGSVGRAAQAHGITQPSASSRLARLERQLGVALFVRSRRGTALTPVGEVVIAWARVVVDSARALTDGVETLRRDQDARLRIAASLTVAEHLMPQWLLRLRRAHPEVDVAVTVENSQEVCAGVRAGTCDVGFIESPELPDDLAGEQVGVDRLALVVARDYPLAARAKRGIRARDLPDLPLLLREPGSGTRDTFLHALSATLGGRSVPAPHAIELGSTTTIVATALAGGGVAVVSARAVAAEIADGRLVEVAVPDLTLTRPLHAVWRGRWPSGLALELIKLARAQ
jgi:DNA-binding transcriptional LysR family regulator